MLIEEKALNHWLHNFYGYGSWNARTWFIDYEEGGGDLPEEVADKMNYFYSKHPQDKNPELCDIRELYRHVSFKLEGPKANVFSNLHDYRFGANAILHGVWKNLIAFEHGYRDAESPDLMAYQKELFAMGTRKNEALIKLYPLPSPHNHAWYYSWLNLPQVDFLKSRALYEQHVYQERIHTILKSIQTYQPEVVLMYSMNNINKLKESVQEFFPEIKFKSVKATLRQIPQHHRVDLQGTILLITTQTPALRHNRIETGFDWQEFGRKVKLGS